MLVIPGKVKNKLRQFVSLRNDCNTKATESARSWAVQIANDLIEAGALGDGQQFKFQASPGPLHPDVIKALAVIDAHAPTGGEEL